jgi:hypothetical protein
MQTIPQQIAGHIHGVLTWPSRIMARLRTALETSTVCLNKTGFRSDVESAGKEVQWPVWRPGVVLFTSLHRKVMSTEQIAIWLLTALKKAWERESLLLTYCTEPALLSQVKYEHTINDADIKRGIRFLVERRMIKTVKRRDGGVRFPSLNGLDYLAAYLETEAANTFSRC